MCPISGLVQFLIVIVTLLLVCHSLVVHSLSIKFEPSNATVHMHHSMLINYTITGEYDETGQDFEIYSENADIASLQKEIFINNPQFPISGSFNLNGNFLGQTRVVCKTSQNNNLASDPLKVVVIREHRVIDTVFTASVATLVSIIYINFGCALNWGELRKNLKRPIGPVIGFFGQFIIMPLLSFMLGKVLFPNNHEMQLGMFFTGVSPAGGASNIWTVILDGNMDLSITMTTISTLAAFGMMPLWIFTLGKLIFEDANVVVPYSQISMYAIGLVIPLAIGFLISKYLKGVAQFLVRILKGFSALLILFIVIFAIVTNLYLFELFSWQIIVAGMGLPYLGFVLGWIVAKLFKQPAPDCLAIAIETAIQNTGIAIFLLRFALPQPQADLTTVAPVSVAIMTPLPLIVLYIYKKIKARLSATHKKLSISTHKTAELIVDKNSFNNNKKTEDHLIATIS